MRKSLIMYNLQSLLFLTNLLMKEAFEITK